MAKPMKRARYTRWPGIFRISYPYQLSNWPGLLIGPRPAFRDTDWTPTGMGPGEGPDLSCPPETYSCPSVSELRSRAEAVVAEEIEHISGPLEVKQAGEILKNKPGQRCPSCHIARLAVDADLHVSCPMCGFGGHRACH